MTTSLAHQFGIICRDRRIDLGTTQAAVAQALEISRSHYGAIETSRANPSIALVERIGEVLGVRFELFARPVLVVTASRVRDSLHACCSGYVARRLIADGWVVRREVAIEDRRHRGWIDILAYDARTGVVLIIEVKTAIDDVGRLERQVGWYERAVASATPSDWRPSSIASWVLVLATDEADQAILRHGDILGAAFAMRAPGMREVLAGIAGIAEAPSRGIALIDPRSRRRDWLIATRADGRRTPVPYQDRSGAIRILDL